MRLSRIIHPLLLVLSACASSGTSGDSGGERVTVTVLGTTDVHGRLVPWDYYRGVPEERGLARVATLVDSIRAASPHVVLLDSGDLLQGNPLDYYYGVVAPADVHPVIEAMNRLEYDAAALGNHEFNYGLDALDRALADADFPFLAGNVFVAGTDSLRWPATVVVERGGVRIGILGLTTPGSAVWDRHHVEGHLEFRDIVASARRWWPGLEAASDVQVIVLHSGMGPGSSYDAATGVPEENAGRALAEALPGIELILLGHSHRDVPSETVNGVLFTQAGKWGEALAVATLELERRDGGWRLADRRATTLPTATVPPDSAFLAALAPAHERVVAWVADTIGWTSAPWSAASARLQDTPILDLIQRVQLDATGADLSAASAFTTETRLDPGPITLADAAGLYLYDNTLQAIEVTGRQLREYLEHSARYFHRVTADGSLVDAGGDTDVFVDSVPGYNYDVVAGVEYALDLTQPVGSRVVELTHQGAPVAPADTFTLALNNYRRGGGGGFAMIAGAPVVHDRGEEVRQLLVDWISARDTVRPDSVFVPTWRLLPEAAAVRFLADTAAWLPAPDQAADDSIRIVNVAEREAGRIAGDARSRVAIESPLPPPLPPNDRRVRLAILATNDFHGALDPLTPAWAGGDTIGGAALLAAYTRAVESRYPGATLHLDGGDVMQGTVISNLSAGRSTVDAFNAIGVDAAAIGNHEFDWGVDTLRARMEQARYPWLSANIFLKATGMRPDWVEPVAWLERAGLKIAVIGASTVATPVTTLPQNVAAYEFRDIADVVNELAPELKAQGADLIMLAVHAGAIADADGTYRGEVIEAARRITAPVDLIVSGHTHSRVDTEVNGIPIVQAASSGTALGVVTLTYDRDAGAVVDYTVDLWTTRLTGARPDPELARLVARWRERVAEIADRPVARLTETLTRARRQESALGDLIADAQRAATDAEIAMVNGGGIRTDLKAGAVTYKDVFAVQPFQNVLVRLELTGTQLHRALEGVVEDRMGQVSGIRFSFDPTRPAGERVVDATLESGAPVVRAGRAVEPDRLYTVTVNNFMASGGDVYTVLQEAPRAVNTGLIDSEVLVEYLAGLPQPVSYDVQGRMAPLAPWPQPIPE